MYCLASPFIISCTLRWSAARAYLEPALNRRYKVHMTTNSVAAKILFSGNRATQVVYSQVTHIGLDVVVK